MRPMVCTHAGSNILLSKINKNTNMQFKAKLVLDNIFFKRTIF